MLYKVTMKKDVNEYKNEFNRQKYDRIGLMLPKGKGDEWKAEAQKRGLSLNAFVIEAVKSYIETK